LVCNSAALAALVPDARILRQPANWLNVKQERQGGETHGQYRNTSGY
jgi:hypothetical protein